MTSTNMLIKPNLDHHGFYTVGNQKIYSKLEAIELSVRLAKPVTWNFNRETFSSIDWSQEPVGSLEFYYCQRALQLREQYDYLVLFYSGGSDSHNMLMSFVNNNIFVDEIVQYHHLEAQNGDRSFVNNLEQFATSIPITQNLIASNPVYKHTIHRLIDFTEFKSQIFKDKKILDQWWYVNNDFYGINAVAVGNIKSMHPAYQQLADSGKKFCFVWAVDKPHMSVDQHNTWTMSFVDSSFSTMVTPTRKTAAQHWDHDELFYWSPDLPELAIKQAHVIKKYVEQFSDQYADGHYVCRGRVTHDQYGQWTDMVNLPSFVFTKNQKVYTMMLDGVRRLLYPWWQQGHVVRPVVQSALFSDSDAAFLNSNTPFDASRREYIKGIVRLRQWMLQHAHQYWYEFAHDPKIAPLKAGIKSFSNSYSLERKTS